jgi:pantothenate kinase
MGAGQRDMKRFVVIVEGNNVIVDKKMCGFYTTRFVEANSESEAVSEAFDLIRKEIDLKSDIMNDRFGYPVLSLYEVNEVEDFGNNSPPGGGFTYYPLEEREGN